MSKSKRIVAISVVVLALIAFGTAAFAFAQEADEPDVAAPANGLRGSGFGFMERMKEALAEALGISVDELEDAQQEARANVIQDAADEGFISEEQAELMLAMPELKEYIDHQALLADVLGVSVEELQAAREEGALRDLIEDTGLTGEEIREAVRGLVEEAIQQAADDGVISQEVADQLISGELRLPGGHRGGHRGFGSHGRPGFRGGRGFGGAFQSDRPFVPAIGV